jgi:hypothetical protein
MTKERQLTVRENRSGNQEWAFLTQIMLGRHRTKTNKPRAKKKSSTLTHTLQLGMNSGAREG